MLTTLWRTPTMFKMLTNFFEIPSSFHIISCATKSYYVAEQNVSFFVDACYRLLCIYWSYC